MKQNRKIKVYRIFRNSGGRYGDNKILPWICISSVWLVKYGFNVGDYIDLTIERNRIIITKCPNENCSETDQRNK